MRREHVRFLYRRNKGAAHPSTNVLAHSAIDIVRSQTMNDVQPKWSGERQTPVLVWAERALLFGLLLSSAAMGVGTAWDIYWHAALIIPGSEPFWSPPHRFLYSGAIVPGVVGVLLLMSYVGRARSLCHSFLAFLRARGYAHVGIGSAIMAAGGACDALWHRYIGDRTIWSPPHVVGVTGAVVIVLGIIIALAGAGRRRILPLGVATTFAVLLLASVLLAAHAALVSVAVAVFFPHVTGLAFYTIHTPYLLAVLAALLMPALVKGYQQLAGVRTFEVASLAAIGLWLVQEGLNHILTPAIATEHGYAVKAYIIPDLQLKVLTLGYMLLPAALINRVAGLRPWIVGAVAGTLYIGVVDLWPYAAAVARNVSTLTVLAAPCAGALSAVAGIVGGRSIGRMWQTAATSESRSMLSWPFARGPALARDPFGRRSR